MFQKLSSPRRPCGPRPKNVLPSFTLIELLIVIAIITTQ